MIAFDNADPPCGMRGETSPFNILIRILFVPFPANTLFEGANNRLSTPTRFANDCPFVKFRFACVPELPWQLAKEQPGVNTLA